MRNDQAASNGATRVVAEWTGNDGDGRLYRNVTIGELADGQAVRVTDY